MAGGGRIRPGALVRADTLEGLTADGWAALLEHGVRTVVDLRNDDERGFDAATRPPEVTTVELALDGVEDRTFWEAWDTNPAFGTPLYYGPHLERFPERSARVVTAVARAAPGGVAVHCVVGLAAFLRDRGTTGAALVAELVRTGGLEDAVRAGGWKGTLLVDGFHRATWSAAEQDGRVTVTVEDFAGRPTDPGGTRAAVEAEAVALAGLLAPAAEADVAFTAVRPAR